jgi:hypothetical protein
MGGNEACRLDFMAQATTRSKCCAQTAQRKWLRPLLTGSAGLKSGHHGQMGLGEGTSHACQSGVDITGKTVRGSAGWPAAAARITERTGLISRTVNSPSSQSTVQPLLDTASLCECLRTVNCGLVSRSHFGNESARAIGRLPAHIATQLAFFVRLGFHSRLSSGTLQRSAIRSASGSDG